MSSSDPTAGRPIVEVPMVEVRGVTKRFGDTVVLDGVDLTVARGEFVCIAGPSGAGKSTLLHLLAALDVPDDGSIVVDGVDVAHHQRSTAYRRSTIGLVFQLHNLIPRLTALENVEVAMLGTHRRRRARRERAAELLAELGIDDELAAKVPPLMSGGERQRVAIARARANDPTVLFADEPTGSLDDASADLVIGVFERARREHGLTIVAISHDARLTARADRALRLSAGAIGPLPPGVPLTAPG